MTAALIDAPPVAAYPPCVACGRATRPSGAPASAYPGTISRAAHGLCVTCYHRTHYPNRPRRGGNQYAGRPADLVEDVDWITHPDNYTDHPRDITRRLGFAHLSDLTAALRKAGAPHLADRLMARADG
jgi:hypothetical protein